MNKHLVVAHYNEDLSWLSHLVGFDEVFVYSKSPSPPPATIPLPNFGRESHTFLHHIVTHWDELPDFLLTAQGDPFAHVPNFLYIANCRLPQETWKRNCDVYPDSRAIGWGYLGLGHYREISKALIAADPEVARDPGLVKWHQYKWIVLQELWRRFDKSGRELPRILPTTWGAQFLVAREAIRQHPLDLYAWLVEMHALEPMMPFALENFWWLLFTTATPIPF